MNESKTYAVLAVGLAATILYINSNPILFTDIVSSRDSDHYSIDVFSSQKPIIKQDISWGFSPDSPSRVSLIDTETAEPEGFYPVSSQGFKKKTPEKVPEKRVSTPPPPKKKTESKVRLRISLEEQRAHLYIDNELQHTAIISSGKPGFETPTGRFLIDHKREAFESIRFGDVVDAQSGKVLKKNVNSREFQAQPGTVFKGKSHTYFLKLFGEVGIHACEDNRELGLPSSRGSIFLDEEKARLFFEKIPKGTLAIIE